jgi:hypothetical protein
MIRNSMISNYVIRNSALRNFVPVPIIMILAKKMSKNVTA